MRYSKAMYEKKAREYNTNVLRYAANKGGIMGVKSGEKIVRFHKATPTELKYVRKELLRRNRLI